VQLVGFIIRIYHDTRTSELQISDFHQFGISVGTTLRLAKDYRGFLQSLQENNDLKSQIKPLLFSSKSVLKGIWCELLSESLNKTYLNRQNFSSK